MNHALWLQAAILVPAAGALLVVRMREAGMARSASVLISGIALVCSLAAWWTFDPAAAELTTGMPTTGAGSGLSALLGPGVLSLDRLSAPLLPWAALLCFLTSVATLDSRLRQSSFAGTLAGEALILATFACRAPLAVAALVALGMLPAYLELRARGRSTRIYRLHAALLLGLLAAGCALQSGGPGAQSLGTFLLLGAVLVRSGIAPFHCWVTDLYEHGTLGTALLTTTPLVGAYAAIRLVLPAAPPWVLQLLEFPALGTAVYAAALTLVQQELRRFFCCLLLSNSALVLLGLSLDVPIGLTGALCLWLAVGLALCGFGLTIRALEARRGRLSLDRFQGLYDHTPNLAMCFGLTAFASIGFPGSFSFIGTELLVDGAVETRPWIGIAIVLAAAINGIAVVTTYFRLFAGTHYFSTVSLKIGRCERYAVLVLAALILLLGLYPQPSVVSRYQAAQAVLAERVARGSETLPAEHWASLAPPPPAN